MRSKETEDLTSGKCGLCGDVDHRAATCPQRPCLAWRRTATPPPRRRERSRSPRSPGVRRPGGPFCRRKPMSRRPVSRRQRSAPCDQGSAPPSTPAALRPGLAGAPRPGVPPWQGGTIGALCAGAPGVVEPAVPFALRPGLLASRTPGVSWSRGISAAPHAQRLWLVFPIPLADSEIQARLPSLLS